MSDTPQNTNRRWLSRRTFLIGLGTGIAGLAVGAPFALREARIPINQAFAAGTSSPLPPLPESPFIWFEIQPDNTAHLYIPKVEMGQGVHTTLAQIAADELELDWDTVKVHQGDIERGFDGDLIFTFGSTSVHSLFMPIREIAATMRQMLRTEAAQQLNIAVDDLVAENSIVSSRSNPDTRLTYGEVVAAKQGEWDIPETPPALKTAAEFRYIGQSVQRVDFADKLTGRAIYGLDARLPNMAYGAVARPPRYGATLKSVSAGDAESQPGVVAVVIEEGFAGVVAETRPQAYAALEHLQLEWEGGTTISQAELEEFVTVSDSGGTLIQREGNVNGAIEQGTLVTAEYRTPMAANAHLEPQAALVDIQGDNVTVYASTQSSAITRNFVSKVLGIEPENVNVYVTYLGGSFGRKTGADAPVEAARLARAVGRPVHVGWNRTEEMRYGYRRQMTHHQLRGAVDSNGNIIAVEHQLASTDVFFYLKNLGTSRFLEYMLGADALAAMGAIINYDVANRRVVYHHRAIPIETAFWRGLGTLPNTFAVESFIDELAHAGNIDPLEIRLNHLPQDAIGERMRVALETVAEASDWRSVTAEGRAKGIALSLDKGTVVALVVEVSADDAHIRVHQAWCAVDPGFVVNPDGAKAQVEGSIIMALSSTLYEKITVENGMVAAANFDTYPLLTMRDAPAIEVALINSSDAPVGGLGEPVIGTIPAAVANAIFTLTGQRLRELPLKLS
jgi:isoquinoline 1-oxidoreductase beta subunit